MNYLYVAPLGYLLFLWVIAKPKDDFPNKEEETIDNGSSFARHEDIEEEVETDPFKLFIPPHRKRRIHHSRKQTLLDFNKSHQGLFEK